MRAAPGAIQVAAVGHRIVHGGTEFDSPALIDAAVEARIEALAKADFKRADLESEATILHAELSGRKAELNAVAPLDDYRERGVTLVRAGSTWALRTAPDLAPLLQAMAGPDPDDPAMAPVAAVCVYPSLVAAARAALGDAPLKVASVAGAFPSGREDLRTAMAFCEIRTVWHPARI